MRNRLWLLIFVVGLIALACGGDDSDAETAAEDQEQTTEMEDEDMDKEDEDMEMEGDREFVFGKPAAAARADRKIEVVTKDDFTYDPSVIEVSKGEAVTFVVTNEGKIVHEFVLGDQAFQDEHEREMAEMEGEAMLDEPNAIALEAGETKELTWRFTETGEFLYACHEEGHYDAGMIGAITVE